jgi:Protein of unknown function (DUF2630)
MDDAIRRRIDELATEEHALRSSGHAITEAERARLHELEVTLDRTWDLLRQRQARREAGQDPEGARERPAGVVEGYLE